MNDQMIVALGILAGALTTAAFVPQVIKSYKTRSTGDLSFFYLLLVVTGVLLWLIYGILAKDIPLIFANAITLCLAFSLFAMKVKWG